MLAPCAGMAVTTAIGNAGELSVLSEHAHTQNAKRESVSAAHCRGRFRLALFSLLNGVHDPQIRYPRHARARCDVPA